MARQRLRIDQVRVGAPLMFDVYDEAGRLLLRRGNRIVNGAQLERLVESGVYADAPGATPDAGTVDDDLVVHFRLRPSPHRAARVSIPVLLGEAAGRLETLLSDVGVTDDFALEIRSLADGIRKCGELDGDAALAHVQLARQARYPIRQALNAALVSAMLFARLNLDPPRASAGIAAALTMNIGMLALQQALYEHRGDITPEDAAAIRSHPRRGADLLRARGVVNDVWLAAVEQHHEARDGSGYPAGLKGDAACREAQVIGLADRYCSMVSERAYRPAFAPAIVLKELHQKHGAAFDPALIGALVTLLGIYPPGTFVKLANGETALVARRLLDVKHPVAYALYLNPRSPYETPRKRLTASQPQFAIDHVLDRSAVTLPIEPELFWPRSVDT
ncbi:MAG TPA: HD domain-containing phosphohydrolase [Burkholderiaceae bacterium]|nr:HD domain-containing phosphohydrolase [Burkholderiaceae bacterium]